MGLEIFQNIFSRKTSAKSCFAVNSQHLFELNEVSKTYGKINALSNIHLKIKKGEIVFITGESGAGKTTLLKILSGEIIPDLGLYTSISNSKYKNLFISKVFQDLRLLKNYTIAENLSIVYDSSLFISKEEFQNELSEITKILGISNRLKMKMGDANGGLMQKVAVARALLCRPDVLIADEPTCSLDLKNATKIFDLLSLYNRKAGLTVIWATHNRELVQKFVGRIVHLENGKIIYSGYACFI